MFAAMCLEVFRVIFGDTRDPNGAERFLQWSLQFLYRPFEYQDAIRSFFLSKPVNIYCHIHLQTVKTVSFIFNLSKGLDCCSNETISFHPVKDQQLLLYDYLVRYNQHLI